MTAAAAGDGPDQRSFDRLKEWAGHHVWLYWVLLIAQPVTRPFGGWVDSWGSPLLMGCALALLLLGTFGHDRPGMMCQRCMRVAPLDPAREIARWDRRLRAVHSLTRGRILLALVGFLAFSMGSSALLPIDVWWVALAVNAVLWSPFLYFSLSAQWHQWLRPWCPYCRRWDDGGEPEQVPDPIPSGERERV